MTKLTDALEIIASTFGVPPPDPEDRDEVLIFLAEGLAAVMLDLRVLASSKRGRLKLDQGDPS